MDSWVYVTHKILQNGNELMFIPTDDPKTSNGMVKYSVKAMFYVMALYLKVYVVTELDKLYNFKK